MERIGRGRGSMPEISMLSSKSFFDLDFIPCNVYVASLLLFLSFFLSCFLLLLLSLSLSLSLFLPLSVSFFLSFLFLS